MKIYILRHEDRTIDASFFSPLTEKGLINANNLCVHLEEINITKIFCSPYIRTMQTIDPFAKKKNIKLHLEYNLIEIQHQDIIPPNSVGVKLPNYIEKIFNYDPTYNSFIEASQINYPENSFQLENRTIKFIKHIVNKYYKTDENILLVTHQGLCKILLKIVNNYAKNKPFFETMNKYPMGTLSLIFDNFEWAYRQIN
jgi:broad specificity phosphatase PhoE